MIKLPPFFPKMPLEFQSTDGMIFHVCTTAKSLLSSFPRPSCTLGERRMPPPKCRMDMCVSRDARPHVVNVPSEIIDPIVRFGIALGLVTGWHVRCPGAHGMPAVMPVGGVDGHTHTYLAVLYLSRTEKGTHLDDGGLCHGDEHVFVMRAGNHDLFGLRVNMGFLLRKDMGF